MLPDCSAVHPFGILLIALGGENGMVDENLAAFVSTAKTVVPNSIDQSFTGGPLAFWWENNMQNSIVGIFSNGFIKLVQKTDITHSNVIVFFKVVFHTNPHTLRSFDERKRKKRKLSAKTTAFVFF